MNVIQRAYKTKIRLNNEQVSYFLGCAGLARFVYNWCLGEKLIAWRGEEKVPSARELKKQFNTLKKEHFSWTGEYPYQILQEAFDDVQTAFDNFWRKRKAGEVARTIERMKAAGKWEMHVARMLRRGYKGVEIEPGFPRFKSRARSMKSFTLIQGIKIETGRIWLQSKIGWVRLDEKGYLPAGKEVNSANVSCVAGKWYVAVQVEEEIDPPPATGPALGVDFGVKALATVSDGTVFDNPKLLSKQQRRLKRLYRQASRQQRGSSNQAKTYDKIAKLQNRVAQGRRNAQHQVSAYVTHQARPATVVVEDLNVAGMLKNGRLAQAIADAGFGELRRQVAYKAGWAGVEVVLADQWFASSKKCSGCGCHKANLTLSDRVYRCDSCGLVVDRDLNAAVNLSRLTNKPLVQGGLPVELGA